MGHLGQEGCTKRSCQGRRRWGWTGDVHGRLLFLHCSEFPEGRLPSPRLSRRPASCHDRERRAEPFPALRSTPRPRSLSLPLPSATTHGWWRLLDHGVEPDLCAERVGQVWGYRWGSRVRRDDGRDRHGAVAGERSCVRARASNGVERRSSSCGPRSSTGRP